MITFCIDLLVIILLIAGIFVFNETPATLETVCNWLISHPAIAILILSVIVLIIAFLKATRVTKSKLYLLWAFLINIFAVLPMAMFIVMYIIPLWLSYGPYNALLETVITVLIFMAPAFILQLVFAKLFKDPLFSCAIDAVAKIAVFVVFYFMLEGMACYMFDYFGILAPLI